MNPITETDVLAPFEIWEVPFDDGKTIKFHEPLVLTPVPLPDDPEEPSASGENNYALIERPDLNISVFAETRDELEEFVLSEIRFIWQRFVLVDDAKLNVRTLAIKKTHLALAEVIDG